DRAGIQSLLGLRPGPSNSFPRAKRVNSPISRVAFSVGHPHAQMRIMLPLAANQNNAQLKRNFAENFCQWRTIQLTAEITVLRPKDRLSSKFCGEAFHEARHRSSRSAKISSFVAFL